MATNGAEAIESVAQLAPDAVLMDAQMPVLDRIEATRTIKASTPDTKILFLSVHPMHLEPGLEAGADVAMLKDIGREGLERFRLQAGVGALVAMIRGDAWIRLITGARVSHSG